MRVITTSTVSILDDIYGEEDDESDGRMLGTTVTNESCAVYAVDRFIAPSSSAPVSLHFDNVTNVAGWFVECLSAATLLVNGGATVAGGYTISLNPAAPTKPASIMVSCQVNSLSIMGMAGATVTGRYAVWGTVNAS